MRSTLTRRAFSGGEDGIEVGHRRWVGRGWLVLPIRSAEGPGVPMPLRLLEAGGDCPRG